MTVAELRKALEGVADDTPVVIEEDDGAGFVYLSDRLLTVGVRLCSILPAPNQRACPGATVIEETDSGRPFLVFT